MAVQELYPGTQVTIGPTIEDGFYYDFATGHRFSREDLDAIEQRMADIVERDLTVERLEVSREHAITEFRNLGEHYKVQIIEALPEAEVISVYKKGHRMDLCRGPHVPSTGKQSPYKRTDVTGAYWRADSTHEISQRAYGTAGANKKH